MYSAKCPSVENATKEKMKRVKFQFSFRGVFVVEMNFIL